MCRKNKDMSTGGYILHTGEDGLLAFNMALHLAYLSYQHSFRSQGINYYTKSTPFVWPQGFKLL